MSRDALTQSAAALVVAAADYRYLPALPDAIDADAHAMAAALADPAVSAYPPEALHLLAGGDATRARVLDSLSALAAGTTADDTVVVYWTGHGGRIPDGGHAGEYLLPIDARLDTPELLAQTAISGREFDQALREIRAGRVAVFFDCCHAGGIGWSKSAAAAPPFQPGLPTAFYEQVLSSRGRAIIASSRADELSWILPGATNSLFTQHLLAGLTGGAADTDGIVRIFDLFEYLQPRVTADQSLQHPVFKADLEHNFPLAAVPAAAHPDVSEDQYRYDVYVSYVDAEPDNTFVWERLLPQLEREGLRVAVSGDVEQPGVARVVSIERGITQARRTVVVLSPDYLRDTVADFENSLAQTMGIQENRYRLLPVQIADIDEHHLPTRIGMLTRLHLTHPRRAERELQRLITAIQTPLEHQLGRSR
jgi:hypothetical protein